MKTIQIILSFIILVSCGARNKSVKKDTHIEDITYEIKADSTGSKKILDSQNTKEDKIVENKATYEASGDDIDVSLLPKPNFPSDSAKIATVKIKTPKGDYEYEIPKGYDFNFKIKNTKEVKTETGKETSTKKEEVTKDTRENAQVARETSGSKKTKDKTKDLTVERKEPIWFNLGFWGLILILIIGGYVYYRFVIKK